MTACGGKNFYSQTSDNLKSAYEQNDPEQVFSIVSDIFSNCAQSGSAAVDISSLSPSKIGVRLQRAVFSGFKKTGILPYVDVKLTAKKLTLHSNETIITLGVSFNLGGESHEQLALATLTKDKNSWKVGGFKYE